MREAIIKLLQQSKKALSKEDIASSLYLSGSYELEQLDRILEELLGNYDIYKTSGDKFLDIENSPIKKGIYRVSRDGKGRIVTPKKTYLVNENNDNNAIDGDTVLFEQLSKGKGNEANILMVANRDIDQIIGEVQNINDEAFLKTDNFKLNKLNIKLTDASLVTGTKVIVKLRPTGYVNEYVGEVVRNIGYKDAPFVDIETACFKHGFVKEFKKESIDQVDKMSTHISDEELEGRFDFRNVPLFTADGKDTKDMDDAISHVKLPNGNDLVGVYIADVTHYMPELSPLDKEAYGRATSGYFANTVIPMLPQKMSNGICSLNPNVDRLAIAFFAEVDKDGEIVDSFITPSVINSKMKMNYDDINKVLEGEEIPEGYEEFVDILNDMNEVSKIQIKNRDRKGALDMDSKELKIYCDENGKPELFSVRNNKDAENIIESFMLLAGQVAPMELEEVDAPCEYRVHARPDIESLEDYINFYHSLGYTYNKDISNSSKSVQALLKEVQTKPEKDVLQHYFLRHLMKAEYSAENIGHSGLAMNRYAQVTSPIRRYNDVVNHRLIKEYVCSGQKFEEKKKKWLKKLSQVYDINYLPGKVEPEPSYQRDNEWRSMLPEMAYHISKREREEIACENEVNRIKSAEYMSEHIGELFDATMVGMNNKFVDVELDNLIQGNLVLDTLPGKFSCNPDHYAVEDYTSGQAFHIGDRVEVQATYANKNDQLVEFAYSKTLSIVNGLPVEMPVRMTKQKRKELKKKHGR